MKKVKKAKLHLDRETVRVLSNVDLQEVGGAGTRSVLYPCVTLGFACGSAGHACTQ
jgi:hypothetical protein